MPPLPGPIMDSLLNVDEMDYFRLFSDNRHKGLCCDMDGV